MSSEDITADQAEAYGYINRALFDADLDAFVEALATRIAKFLDKWAIAHTKRLVNTSLPPDVELGAGWDACIASLGRPAAQDGIKALMVRGFHKPGDVENRAAHQPAQIEQDLTVTKKKKGTYTTNQVSAPPQNNQNHSLWAVMVSLSGQIDVVQRAPGSNIGCAAYVSIASVGTLMY